MYFQEFPKIYYDFPSADGKSSSLQVLTDITVNVRVRKQILENITLYDEYDIKEGETPEIIAEKYYGNPELHWVIMLVNQRYDYLKDFPMSREELFQYSLDKYGADNLDKVHHYELDGKIVQAKGTLLISKAIYESAQKYDILQNAKVNAMVLSKSLDEQNTGMYYAEVIVNKGEFIPTQFLNLGGVRINPFTRKNVFMTIDTYSIPYNSFTLAPGYSLITNFAYEDNLNESKRRIKLISPTLVGQIVKEFKKLVNQ